MNHEKLLQSIQRIAFAFGILHLNVNLGRLNVLPDWLGYVMIMSTMETLSQEEPSATLLRPLGQILVGWTLAEWCAQLLGTALNGYALAYIVAVVRLYFQFQLLTNLAAVAVKYAPQFKQRILQLRTVMTAVVTAYALSTDITLSKGLEIVVAVVYCGTALWLVRTLMHMGNHMEIVFGLVQEREPTFAERIQMNNENAGE